MVTPEQSPPQDVVDACAGLGLDPPRAGAWKRALRGLKDGRRWLSPARGKGGEGAAVDVLAVRLMVGRGVSPAEAARACGVAVGVIARRARTERWRELSERDLRRLTGEVVLGALAKAAEEGRPADPDALRGLAVGAGVRAAGTGALWRPIDPPPPDIPDGEEDADEEDDHPEPDWLEIAHAAQRPPPGDWRFWLFLGGRGAGKTRAGAEWVRRQVESGAARRVALVGPTLQDVREVMIEGPSGLARIGPAQRRPAYVSSRRRLVWPNGAEGFAFSAGDADSLRGPQFDAAWGDEVGAWPEGEQAFDMLSLGLRLGTSPRAVLTTTPRPTPLLRRLAGAPGLAGVNGVVVTRAATHANAANLAPGFIAAVEAAYAGTGLGRREIDGEMVDDPEGALWRRDEIEAGRLPALWPDPAGEPAYVRVVVAVDPPASSGAGADACGIVGAGLTDGGAVHVLADASVRGLRPMDWAKRVLETAEAIGAGDIIAEGNQGGDMVKEVLLAAAGEAGVLVNVRLTHARMSKRDRAAPVAARYQTGEIRHRGVFRELEDEMCAFGAPEPAGRMRRSPDRVDALVWACGELLKPPRTPPRIRWL